MICLEGFKATRLLTASEAMDYLLDLLYAGKSQQRKTFEKRERNAEIYRRYLAGEDSVVLGRAYGLSDRRIRDIINQERREKRKTNQISPQNHKIRLSPLACRRHFQI